MTWGVSTPRSKQHGEFQLSVVKDTRGVNFFYMNISENTRSKSKILGTPNQGPMTNRFLIQLKKLVHWTVPLWGYEYEGSILFSSQNSTQ